MITLTTENTDTNVRTTTRIVYIGDQRFVLTNVYVLNDSFDGRLTADRSKESQRRSQCHRKEPSWLRQLWRRTTESLR